ncbi:hypothetical protein [Ramlibacter montanisoli]|uniref:Uncharacterized protein n=1 Tax=Ramlibacter montanisoli TaxID=2732512 RepID=A0A849KD69_9BURK|nr:hypothetical protein [Ramlibacter montanisoli]NNU42945.1 hypothetical protein [Ramlibacter montanisoli]
MRSTTSAAALQFHRHAHRGAGVLETRQGGGVHVGVEPAVVPGVQALQLLVEAFAGRLAARGIDVGIHQREVPLLEVDALALVAEEQVLPHGLRKLVQHLVRKGFQQQCSIHRFHLDSSPDVTR